MLEHARRGGRAEVSFVLPAGQPPGLISVVGDFNGWNPDAHILKARRDGMRAATLALRSGHSFAFRYLAADGSSYIELGADRFDDLDNYIDT